MTSRHPDRVRICFYSHMAYPLFKGLDLPHGGAEVDLYFLAKELAKKPEYAVDFLVGDYGQPRCEKIENVTVIKLNYLGKASKNFFKKIYYKLGFRLNALLRLWQSNADVFFTEAASEVLGYMALVNKLIRRRKLIFRTAHDSQCEKGYSSTRGLFMRWYDFGVKRVDVIIAQTDHQRRRWKEVHNRDSILIENAFPIDEQQPSPTKTHVLWCARAENWKRPQLLLDLAERLPQEDFLMILGGKNHLQAEILERSRRIPNLRILDYVPFHKIQGYFDGAKCFVNTSSAEGFPNTFLHALLGRTPLVSLAVNPDRFITQNDLGICCDNNLEAAVSFIRGLDAAALSRYGKNALQYMKKHHDLKEKVATYDKCIKELLCQRFDR